MASTKSEKRGTPGCRRLLGRINIPNTMNVGKSLFSMMCKVKKGGQTKIK